MNLKVKCFIILINFGCIGQLHAQYPAYKAVTFKTNIMTLFNGSVDFPLYKRFTGEIGYRYFGGETIFLTPETQSTRVNLKFHFPLGSKMNYEPSFYLFVGSNDIYKYQNYYQDERNSSITICRFKAKCLTMGIGFKTRRVSFWVASENPYYVNHNSSLYQGTTRKWQETGKMFSGGIAITVLNIKMPPSETNLYRWLSR